jgi:hypothetical protein
MRSLNHVLGPLVCLAAGVVGQGKVFMTAAEAIDLAFPKCQIERTKHVLDKAKKERVLKLSGHKAARSMVFAYQAKKEGKIIGTAYFDRHRVRSKQEIVMIVVDPLCKIRRIEVVAFGEPLDYLPRQNFYAQILGRGLDRDLSTSRAIRSVAGSTLTVNATVAVTRRILAVHQLLFPKQVAKVRKPKKPVGVEPVSKPVTQTKPETKS